MPDFGKRKPAPRMNNLQKSLKDKKSISEVEFSTQKGMSHYTKLSAIGFFVGLTLFVTLEIGVQFAFKKLIAAPLEKKLAAQFEGVEPKNSLEYPVNYHTLKPQNKQYWEMTQNALEVCQHKLKTDWSHQNTTKHLEFDADVRITSELELRDLGYFLPCLMDHKPERLCELGVKQDLIKRLKEYFTTLDGYKRQRQYIAKWKKQPNQVFAQEMNAHFKEIRNALKGEPRSVVKREPLSTNIDERIIDGMRFLAEEGYISPSDFTSWFGMITPKHIEFIFNGIDVHTYQCRGA